MSSLQHGLASLTQGTQQVRESRIAGALTHPMPTSTFILSSFFQRLGIWIGGFPFPSSLILCPAFLAVGFFRGYLKIDHLRLIFFVFLAGSVGVSTFWGEYSKPTAALMYLLIYALWVLYWPTNRAGYENYLRRIALYVSLICIIGVVQYFAQFLTSANYVFSWRGIIPKNLLIEYNTLNELTYDSHVYKSNGFFLMEASFLSGLAARELLIVVMLLKDTRYIIPLALGLAFALSGQGIVFALLFVSFPLADLLIEKMRSGRDKSAKVQAILGISAIVIFLVVFAFFSDYFINRVGEFSSPRSSAYARYTSSLIVFNEDVVRNFRTFLFGYGPGGFGILTNNSPLAEHCTGWIKLFVELGLLGVLSFSAFFLVSVYTATRSWYISLAMLFHYLVLDSTLLVPQLSFLAYALFILPKWVDESKNQFVRPRLR